MILLAQYPLTKDRGSGLLRSLEDSARQNGIQVQSLPIPLGTEFEFLNIAADQEVLFSGYLPNWSHYEALEEFVLSKGSKLINSANASRQCSSIKEWYPLLRDYTAETEFVENGKIKMDFPVFVKGDYKSQKEQGWKACVAESLQELSQFGNKFTARELLDLKTKQSIGFPEAREYRVYVLDNQVIGYGYYWAGQDPWGKTDAFLDLATQASLKLDARLVCVDVAETKDGQWKIIEVGDPQHSGIAHMPHSAFFR